MNGKHKQKRKPKYFTFQSDRCIATTADADKKISKFTKHVHVNKRNMVSNPVPRVPMRIMQQLARNGNGTKPFSNDRAQRDISMHGTQAGISVGWDPRTKERRGHTYNKRENWPVTRGGGEGLTLRQRISKKVFPESWPITHKTLYSTPPTVSNHPQHEANIRNYDREAYIRAYDGIGYTKPTTTEHGSGRIDHITTMRHPNGENHDVHHKIPHNEIGYAAETLLRSAPASFNTTMPSMGYSTTMGTRGRDSINIRGNDYVGIVTSTLATQASGNIVFQFDINPKTLNLPRLTNMASLYEMYDMDIEFVYAPAASSSQAGSFVCFFDMDVDDNLPPGLDARIRSAYGHAGATTGNWWTPMAIRMPKKKGKFYVDAGDEDRLTNLATFNMIVQNDGNPTTDVGVMYCKYSCNLMRSKIDGDGADAASYFSGTIANTSGIAAAPLNAVTAGQNAWSVSPGSGIVAPYVTSTSSVSSIYIPTAFQGTFYMEWLQAGTVTTTMQFTLTNLTNVSTEYMTTNAGSTTVSAVLGAMYYCTATNTATSAVDPAITNTIVQVSCATLTTPTLFSFKIIPLDYRVRLSSMKRLEHKFARIKEQAASLITQVKLLETAEEKKSAADGTLKQDLGLDVSESEEDEKKEMLQRRDRHRRRLEALTVWQEEKEQKWEDTQEQMLKWSRGGSDDLQARSFRSESFDDKGRLDRVVGRSREPNTLQTPKGDLRPAVEDSQGKWAIVAHDDYAPHGNGNLGDTGRSEQSAGKTTSRSGSTK